MSWKKYDPNNIIIPEGIYSVRIDEAWETITRHSCKDMTKLKIRVIGKGILFYYLVHDYERVIDTNRKFKAIYDSFGLPEGSTDVCEWAGALGAACIKHRSSYYSENCAEAYIAYFLPRSEYPELFLAAPEADAAEKHTESDAPGFTSGDSAVYFTEIFDSDFSPELCEPISQ